MNRTVKEVTAKTFHHDDLESLKTHVFTFVTATLRQTPQGIEMENTVPKHL